MESKKGLNNETTVETVVILRGVKTNSHISVKLDVNKLKMKQNL